MSWRNYVWIAVVLGTLYLLTSRGRADQPMGNQAAEAGQEAPQVDKEVTQDGEVEAQRQWLRDQLATGLTSKRLLEAMNARVDEMTPKQIARAIAVQTRKAAIKQKEFRQAHLRRRQVKAVQDGLRLLAAREFGFRNGFRRGYWNGYWDGYGPIGYAPVVTWLPSGTQLSAGVIVSPDGRSVRVRATPLFSHVGPVDTFNFVTGRSRRREPRNLEVWHDGLRTRYGVRPERTQR